MKSADNYHILTINYLADIVISVKILGLKFMPYIDTCNFGVVPSNGNYRLSKNKFATHQEAAKVSTAWLSMDVNLNQSDL
jgi:hypothetical protein